MLMPIPLDRSRWEHIVERSPLVASSMHRPGFTLEQKEDAALENRLAAHAAVPHLVIHTSMTHTIHRVIPAVDDDGSRLEIPSSAWSAVKLVAKEEFGAHVSFHLHPEPGFYHGFRYVPFAHYFIEITLEEELVEAFNARINPLVNAIITRHP